MFKCDVCNSSFQTKPELYDHKFQIHPEIREMCEKCKKVFIMKEDLETHLETCQFTAKSRPNLQKNVSNIITVQDINSSGTTNTGLGSEVIMTMPSKSKKIFPSKIIFAHNYEREQ